MARVKDWFLEVWRELNKDLERSQVADVKQLPC